MATVNPIPCCRQSHLLPTYPAGMMVGTAGPLPSFPRKRESRTALPDDAVAAASNRGIPAYAGMTVGMAGKYGVAGLPGSRLRGNDGGG